MIHEFHKTGKIEPVPVFKNPLIKNTAGGSGITQRYARMDESEDSHALVGESYSDAFSVVLKIEKFTLP